MKEKDDCQKGVFLWKKFLSLKRSSHALHEFEEIDKHPNEIIK